MRLDDANILVLKNTDGAKDYREPLLDMNDR